MTYPPMTSSSMTPPPMSRRLRVLVVMPGHLATTPRMLKAADSFAQAGHDVRVLSAGFLGWAREADRRTAAARPWRWEVVEHGRDQAPLLNAVSGVRRHAARTVDRLMGPARAPWWAASRALSRVHDELVRKGLSRRFDLVYGGSIGGLAVAEEIARRGGTAFGVDLEDLYTAESVQPDAALHHGLARRVLGRVLPRAAFVTTASEPMAECYRAEFGIAPAVIHNVFPLPERPPSFERRPGPLRVYWFSQTIGSGRGIEDAIAAVTQAGIEAEIVLRGRASGGYADDLQRAAAAVPRLTIRIEEPADPDRMVDLCEGYDLGLAGESERVKNRQVCLSNKIFTYLLAGMPVALSDTEAQRRLASCLGDAAFLYQPSDTRGLAEWLRALAADEGRLRRHRLAAWDAAVQRWHWNHPSEEGTLLSLATRTAA